MKTLADVVARLERLAAEPVLTVTVDGGGIPTAQAAGFDYLLVVGRGEVHDMLAVLKEFRDAGDPVGPDAVVATESN
jgi:hypothetical protein